jgi:hypothetical protein
MADDVNVDWTQMQASRDGIATAYGKVQQESQDFHASTGQAAEGEPWGINNAVGQAIGMCYGAVSAIFADCHQQNLAAYAGYPQGIDQMVLAGDATEQANTDGVNSMGIV